MTIVPKKTCKKVRYEVMHHLLHVSCKYRNNISVYYILTAGQQKTVHLVGHSHVRVNTVFVLTKFRAMKVYGVVEA
jgi:hypothetical protein